MTSPDRHPQQPNHHAGHSPFDGATGTLVGLTMIAGRRKDARLACDLVSVERGDVVADVGCGPGVAAREAARRGAHVTGVDPATSMLRLARLLRGGPIDYVEGSAEAVPLEDHTQTVVWSLATAHHWQDVDRGVAEALRVLRAGGRFLVIERRTTTDATGLRSHGWTPEQAEAFAAVCSARGFTHVRVERCKGRLDDLAVLAVAPTT